MEPTSDHNEVVIHGVTVDLLSRLRKCLKRWCARYAGSDHAKKHVIETADLIAEIDQVPQLKYVNRQFVERMEKELIANEHKGDWTAWKPDRFQAASEIHHHARKLIDAIYAKTDADVQHCAADLSNMAMKTFETFEQVETVAP
jgi:hypothetical protein